MSKQTPIVIGSRVEEKVNCSSCGKEVGMEERRTFKGKGKSEVYFCDECMTKINQAYEAESKNPNLMMGTVGGLLAGIMGGAGWYLFTIATKREIGYLAIALGWLVGTGVHVGAGKKRSSSLQLVAGVVTVLSLLVAEVMIFSHFSVPFVKEAYGVEINEIDFVLTFLTKSAETRNFFIQAFTETAVSPIGLLIWGLAVYAGVKVVQPRKLK